MWKELKKFSPSQCDLSTMVSNINVMLRLLTLNIDSRVTSPIPLWSRIVATTCVCSYYYTYHISLLWFVLQPHADNFLVAVIVFGSLTVSSHVAFIKLFHMIAYRSRVCCLVNQCMEVDAVSEPGSRFAANMLGGLRPVKLRAIAFWLCFNVIAILYLTIPIFRPGRHLPEDLLVVMGLDPWHQSPKYELSYLVTSVSVYFICYTSSTTFAFMIIILGYLGVQMTSLSREIRCVWHDAVQDAVDFKLELICPIPKSQVIFDDYTKVKINAGLRRKLVDIVQRHSRIITLLKSIDEFFNVPNAIAFASLGASLIAELLGGLQNTYLQVPYSFFQVVMDCYIGKSIVDSSQAIEKAVYACKWENFDQKNMKIILLMLQNSQKTLKVTAGSMAVMNYTCLMSIVRSVYSTYTTLHSTMRQKL